MASQLSLLIVPEGIEISDEQDDGIDRFALLIVPEGIEIRQYNPS